jgi:hemolysin activation/secretion protein
LRLVATEGFVSGIDVFGTDKRKVLRAVVARAQRMQEDRPLRKSTVDRVTALLSDIPGVTVSMNFKSDPQTGDTRATINVAAKSAQGSFSLDRRGITLLGRTHAQLDVQGNSLFVGADQLRLSVLGSTAEDSIQYQSLSYQMPVDGNGSTLSLSVGRQRTRPTILPLDGRAKSFGVQFSHPVWRGAKRSLFLTLAFDGLDSHNALLGYTLSNDRIRAARVGASYVKLSDTRLISLGITASQGLTGLGARVTPGQANTDFTKFTLKANAAQALSADTAVRVGFFGQWTGGDLPSSEQASFGGDEFGRAYAASAVSGDIGVAGSLEVAWRPSSLPRFIAGSEVYVFADAGTVKMRARQGIAADSWSVASLGAGARMSVARNHVLEIEGAHGFVDPVFYAPGKTRVIVSLRSSF